jgi:hypothetical protein
MVGAAAILQGEEEAAAAACVEGAEAAGTTGATFM